MLKDDEILRVLSAGVESRTKYSEKIRQFCLALHFHSPRAYEFVRKQFNNHLPNATTIRKWYQNSNIRGEPGIQEEHIQRLKKIVDELKIKSNTELLCSLAFDEMSIRKQIYWSLHQLDYVGHVNIEQNEESGSKFVAKQALVFILTGINLQFEFPVAYYFIDKVDKNLKKKLLQGIIRAVSECGVKISNITFDGYANNIPMCESLGANLNVFSPEFKPYFINEISNEKIFVITDPCHMQKLIRNTLASKEVIYDENNEKIEWKYFILLQQYSKENDMQTHKLTKKHIQWSRNAMNVRLSNETLSESVAASMQFLKDNGHPGFENSGPTIKFIRKVNSLFDIFNTRNTSESNIFKKALNPENKRVVFDFFHSCISYFNFLKIDVETKNKKHTKILPVLNTRNRTAFRGFIIDMHSLMAMYKKYVEEENLLKTIPTYYLLQDPVEMFFGRIRSRCGMNNNPNVHQFKGCFRRLLANMKLMSSPNENCRIFDDDLPDNLHYSDIYFVSSRKVQNVENDFEEQFENQKDEILQEITKVDEAESCSELLNLTSNYTLAYIASSIESKIMNCPRFYCGNCKSVFDENEKVFGVDFDLIKSKPCKSTFQICKHAEKFFKLYDIHKSNKFNFKVIYCLIFRSLDFDVLFNKSIFECDVAHKYQFVKCIVGEYIAIRAAYVSRQTTFDQYDKIFRQQLRHLVIDNGQ